MKVFKNKKQRIVAVFLSLVFAFMLVPFTDAYASTTTVSMLGIDRDDSSNNTQWEISLTCDSPIYVFQVSYGDFEGAPLFYRIVSASYFTYTKSTTGSTGESRYMYYKSGSYVESSSYPVATGVDVRFYFYDISTFYPSGTSDYNMPENYIVIPYDSTESCDAKISKFIGTGDDTGFDYSNAGGAGSEGGIDNPIYDEEIGTLIISKSKMYEESNGNDVNDLYNLFSWKMKTNTGFSLSDNKYARTFIQVRVESKCVVYDDRRHTKLHKKFDNYGEKAMLINSHPVDSQPLKISYLTDIPNVLPKTHAETHNPVYTGYNYTLYFRVVCTDDLSVIPSDTSEWHCGGWRALDCNADILVGQSNTTENGGFDDEDNWVADEDDGNNHIESGSDSVHDTDDAKDDFNNSSPEVDSSVNGAISTLQSLLDMIRHVPEIISILFSFLPPWCLSLVSLGFVALVVLIIYKLVRG